LTKLNAIKLLNSSSFTGGTRLSQTSKHLLSRCSVLFVNNSSSCRVCAINDHVHRKDGRKVPRACVKRFLHASGRLLSLISALQKPRSDVFSVCLL